MVVVRHFGTGTARPATARVLWNALTRIFPEFVVDLTEQDLATSEREGTATLHSVMLPFTQYFGGVTEAVSGRQVAAFAQLINDAVAIDDDLENAVSTCFLEHLRQIGGYKTLAPFLSKEAKRRTHA